MGQAHGGPARAFLVGLIDIQIGALFGRVCGEPAYFIRPWKDSCLNLS